ncbi:MAG: aminopeptidase [Mycobacterium sp.]
MSLRRVIFLAGAVALIAGVIALLIPVSVSGEDGQSLGCGNAVAVDLSEARAANDRNLANVPILNQILPSTDYVAECQEAVSGRRAWSIPVAVVGALAIAGALVAGRTSARGAVS